MAFKPGSNQRDYTLCSQYDDALDLPELPALAEDASADAIAAHEAVLAERAHKLKVARETSNYDAIIKPGKRPAIFHMRNVSGTALDWWHGQPGGFVQKRALLLRLALKMIEGFDAKLTYGETSDGDKLLSAESLNVIYAMEGGNGRNVVVELAEEVAQRTFQGVGPLS